MTEIIRKDLRYAGKRAALDLPAPRADESDEDPARQVDNGPPVLFVVGGAGSRMVRLIATTDDIDLVDEVVVPGGASLGYFNANRAIFIDHDTSTPARVGVAKSIDPWPTGGRQQRGWVVEVTIDQTPLGDEVLAKCHAGGMGASIGFRAQDYGSPTYEESTRYTRRGKSPRSIVRTWEWVELSITPMPCNVACRAVAVGSDTPRKRATPKRRKQIVFVGGVAYTRFLR